MGLVTGQARIGGTGPQMYHCYPGTMEILDEACKPDCEFTGLTATAVDLAPNLPAR